MEAFAKARFVRIAPRKTRLLVALVRGMNVAAARAQLTFSKKQSSTPILKVLNSAVANATENLKLDPTNLVVSKAWVDEGPSFFRFTPKAHGRATPIRHRMSHITIVVAPKA
jgi:large subunit ribosomal protein L22